MYSKIFYIGLSRNGTTSTHFLLEKLGLKSAHFVSPLLNHDWEVVNQYDAPGDTPIPLLFKECDQRFPNSKFILTTRNKDRWLDSMKWMFRHGRVLWNRPLSLGAYHRQMYGINRFNQEILAMSFEHYHLEVRNYFKIRSEGLLEVNIDNGFEVEKVCTFLELSPRKVIMNNAKQRSKANSWQFLSYYVRQYMIYPLIRLGRKFRGGLD